MEVEAFLSEEQEKEVVQSIREAESNTSGEIRVHFEKSLDLDPIKRAQELFYHLGMDKTQFKNGVLFYVAVDDHKFAIIGDEGIDKVVPDDFWESIKDEVINEFKKGNPTQGLVLGILHAGEKLKEYFPYGDKDENELSDEISKRH
ncbi:TPM domain-containing protein [Lutimonas halocynthiae]|uniref:TPM domain-containing protein n=1 Tax=Lutimonas halocynthiae TaxID=1446477 RepID=UPI0025B49DCD|nr:TPM domain-containing protein [Lutimonas halocynthiae]MDN3641869.1 TPM domain-containing protein [Lutimonas halocynthiae]